VRQILHIDMDAFYASVEQRDDPALRGKPVVVGGRSRRGVVSAASYEARPFGVRSAMPMAEALRLCPQAVVIPPRMSRYVEVSGAIFEIFHRYTPLVQGLSLDEAFLDVTASRSLFGDGEAIASQIKRAIAGELGLTASAGVAPCKFVAKVASDLRKPDGLVVVPEGGVAALLSPLPIERMWGVGPKTAPKLRGMGITTLGDLAQADPSRLESVLGTWGAHVRLLARGEDDRDVDPNGVAKSVGAEETYEEDLRDRAAIERTLLDHAARVAQRLVREGLSASGVALKVKYSDFVVRTRREMLPAPVGDTDSIYRAAAALLDRVPIAGRRVRLTGVSVFALLEGPPPPQLFPDRAAEKRRRLEEVTAKLADRFGGGAVTRAALLDDARGGNFRGSRTS
jgi:DNA polymerase-4